MLRQIASKPSTDRLISRLKFIYETERRVSAIAHVVVRDERVVQSIVCVINRKIAFELIFQNKYNPFIYRPINGVIIKLMSSAKQTITVFI